MHSLTVMIISFILFFCSFGINLYLQSKPTVFRHELGHVAAIKKCAHKRELDSLSECMIHIKPGDPCHGFTESAYLKYLEEHRTECADDIKQIAKAGVLSYRKYMPMFAISLVITAICPPTSVILGVYAAHVFLQLLGYATSKHPGGDKYYFKHPECFAYSAGLENYKRRPGEEVINFIIVKY